MSYNIHPQVGHTKIFLGFAAVLKYSPGWPAAHQHRLLLKLVGSPNFWGGWHQAGEFEQAEFHFHVAHFHFRLLTLFYFNFLLFLLSFF